MDNELANNITTNNLGTTLDGIQQYQFYINGQPQPTRAVEVGDYSKAEPTTNQVALWELQKGLSSADQQVRDLNDCDEHFAIGRCLAKYGGVYNLKEVGGLALKQEYTGATKNKLLISFVSSLRRLVVNSGGKNVEL